jgi:ClpP class serine protease
MRRKIVALLVPLVGLLTVDAAFAAKKAANAPLLKLFETSWQEDLADDPMSATALGDHRFDNLLTDMSPEAIAKRNQLMYTRLAALRKIPKEKVLDIAKGRIWSGQDAKNLGLVDELGGFDEALKLAKKSANIADNEDVKVVVFPKEKSLWESFIQRQGPDSSDKESAARAMAEMFKVVQPVAKQLGALGVIRNPKDQDDVLMMPVLEAGR